MEIPSGKYKEVELLVPFRPLATLQLLPIPVGRVKAKIGQLVVLLLPRPMPVLLMCSGRC